MNIVIILSICFVFSLLVSFIYQTIVNHNLMNLIDLTDYDLLFDEPLEIGDDVYDLHTGFVAKYCGEALGNDNNLYSIIVFCNGNTLHVECSLQSQLIKIASEA